MASYERCLLISLLITSLFIQIYAREAKFFSKVSKPTKEIVSHDSISVTPVTSPAPAPALSAEPEVVEHGYGLYGRDPYENTPKNTGKGTEQPVFEEERYVPAAELSQSNNGETFEKGYSKDNFDGSEYKYTPTMENPTKTPIVDEEKFVDTNEFNNNNKNNNEFVSEKQGMSDTRFLENGKYYYDINHDSKNVNTKYVGSLENEEKNENEKDFASERQGMSDTRFLENGKYYYDVNQHGNKGVSNNNNNNYVRNEGNDEGYVPQKQGMSDTKYMENGEYFSNDFQNEEGFKGKNDEVLFDANNNEMNEQFQQERHGMSDTHYLNNGKYFYDVNNEIVSHNNMYNNMNNNKGYVNENQGYSNFEESNSKNYPNEYVTQGKKGNFGYPKKFPNEYATMEEYDREQGYVDPKDVYVP